LRGRNGSSDFDFDFDSATGCDMGMEDGELVMVDSKEA